MIQEKNFFCNIKKGNRKILVVYYYIFFLIFTLFESLKIESGNGWNYEQKREKKKKISDIENKTNWYKRARECG